MTAIFLAPALGVLAAPADEDRTAGPLALLVIALLGIAVYFLARSMAKHLRRVPPSFDPPPDPHQPDQSDQSDQPGQPASSAVPDEEPPPR